MLDSNSFLFAVVSAISQHKHHKFTSSMLSIILFFVLKLFLST